MPLTAMFESCKANESEGNFMRRLSAIFLVIPLLITSPVGAQDTADRVTVTWSDPSRPGLIKVNLLNGGITVKTHTANDVIVTTNTTRRPGRRGAPAEANGLRRIDSNGSGLTIEEENNVMKIGTSNFGGACCTNIEIQVPPKTNLNLQSLNGGEIVVDGVEGEIEATNNNGGLVLNNVVGSVVAHSLNGKVTVSLRQVTGNKPMAFTSLNGSIDVTLPANIKANLKMRTDNGDVYSDFDIQLRPSDRKPTEIDKRKQGGPFRIEIDKSVNGTINGGGPDFDIRTLNGNIYIRKGQ
jgi:hypothetical protein